MLANAGANVWLAALIFCAGSTVANATDCTDRDPAWKSAADPSELAEVLENWLDNHSDYKRRQVLPKVETISAQAPSVTDNGWRGHGRTRGLYDAETSTIQLIQPWDSKNAQDVSILLHELVHHRQVGHHFYCPGVQEEAAYRIQDKWLGEMGLQADVFWFAVVLEAGCAPRDIHPD